MSGHVRAGHGFFGILGPDMGWAGHGLSGLAQAGHGLVRAGSQSGFGTEAGYGPDLDRFFFAFWVPRMLEIIKENTILDPEFVIFFRLRRALF